jgi:hypothetical protein
VERREVEETVTRYTLSALGQELGEGAAADEVEKRYEEIVVVTAAMAPSSTGEAEMPPLEAPTQEPATEPDSMLTSSMMATIKSVTQN